MPGPGRSTFGSALPSHSRSLTPVLQNRSDHLAPRLFYKCGTYGTGGGHDVTNITENSRMETAPPGAPLSVGCPQTAARPRGDGGARRGRGRYLQLLQLTHVALTLGQHVPHLVLVFLLLLQPLCLLPLFFLLGELQPKTSEVAPSGRRPEGPGCTQAQCPAPLRQGPLCEVLPAPAFKEPTDGRDIETC